MTAKIEEIRANGEKEERERREDYRGRGYHAAKNQQVDWQQQRSNNMLGVGRGWRMI